MNKESKLDAMKKHVEEAMANAEARRPAMIQEFQDDPNNMFNWYPKLASVADTPRTLFVPIEYDTVGDFVNGDLMSDGVNTFLRPMMRALDKIGYPAFLRSGIMSGKHDWKHSCFIERPLSHNELAEHVYRIIEANAMAFGVSMPTVFAAREIIKTKSIFNHFWGEMPITKERRYFIKDGAVVCHHPYWPEEAFHDLSPGMLSELHQLNHEAPEEVSELTTKSLAVAKAFDGYWSLDWLQDVDGKWWAIDMALGARSFHWRTCEEQNRTRS